MRRSGTSHISATATIDPPAIHGSTNASGDRRSRRGPARACPSSRRRRAASSESAPCVRDERLLQDRSRRRRPSAGRRRRAAVGSGAKWFSPIQAVANGNSDSQNSRCRFAHSTPPLTRVGGVQHVMVVVPVDAEVDEAQHVAEEHGHERPSAARSVAVRHLQLQHHDGDDDGDHAVAERLEPILFHDASSPTCLDCASSLERSTRAPYPRPSRLAPPTERRIHFNPAELAAPTAHAGKPGYRRVDHDLKSVRLSDCRTSSWASSLHRPPSRFRQRRSPGHRCGSDR